MRSCMLTLATLISFSTFFTGCSKEPLKHLNEEETRIYMTNFDSSANFSSYKTYSIADSVAVIDNGHLSKEATVTDIAYINAVKNYMEQRGYVLKSKSESPDLAITVNRIYNTSTGVITYGDYYDSYYGGYWDPYYWGYPGYGYYVPYSYAIYEVTEGAISVDMLDLRNAPTGGKINLVWNGLIRGEGIFNSSLADTQVKALFDQSPYLNTNQ